MKRERDERATEPGSDDGDVGLYAMDRGQRHDGVPLHRVQAIGGDED